MTASRIAGLVLALAGGLDGAASAASLDLSLANKAARIAYALPLTDTGLHGDFAVLHHEDDGDLFSAGLHLVDDAAGGTEPFKVGIGARLYAVDASAGPSGTALGIGGWGRYVVPQYNRFAVGGSLHIAPSVTSFGDASRLLELSLRGEYRILRRASVAIGWRRVELDFEGGPSDVKVDDGLHLGIGIEF